MNKSKKVCKNFHKTGMNKTIHNQFLDSKLANKELAIKRGIKNALYIIDCERDSTTIRNSKDAEARIVMSCILEEL